MKFISIQPNNIDIYRSDKLNLIMDAKKLMNNKDLKGALKKIKYIDSPEKHFSKWKSQVQIYLEFKDYMSKLEG